MGSNNRVGLEEMKDNCPTDNDLRAFRDLKCDEKTEKWIHNHLLEHAACWHRYVNVQNELGETQESVPEEASQQRIAED
jgi:hypothetical protein